MNFKSDTSRIGFASDPGKWTKLAIAVGAASMALTAVNVTAEEAEEEQVELETYTFTGSRVKRTAVEGALPVTVIERADIDRAGDVSVADFIRGLSVNSFGSFRQQSGSSAQGLATVNLRGLGSERTLVLIDGHRAPKAPYAATATDLNAIPLAAVERIEILKDGASAVYGSDAIAGVVNIIMRTDYEGASVMYGRSYTSVEGGDKREGSVLVGMNGDNGNVILGASFNSTDIIYSRNQREYTPPGASFYSNNYFGSGDGYTEYHPVPGGCEGEGFSLVPYLDANGDPLNESGTRCAYDFTSTAANEASTEVKSLFAKGIYNINEDWDFYTTASFANSESFGRYAPAADFFFLTGDVSGIDHDQNGVGDDAYILHRFVGLGTRDNTVSGYVADLTTGIKGTVADTVDVDFGARYNNYKTYDVGRNYPVIPVVEAYASDGTYNYVDPFANEDDVLNAMKATISRESTWKTQEVWLNGSTSLFDMAGGMAGVAAGLEYREIEYMDQYDSLSEAGAIGGSSGNSAGADRDIKSLYTEVFLPFSEIAELDLAVRYDKYSDYGSDLSPKASIRVTPTDTVTLRASYGQGFRAPTLDVISQEPAFSAESVYNDEVTCQVSGGTFTDGSCDLGVQVNTTQTSNPDLQSETSKQFTAGVVFAPSADFDISLDAYKIKIEDSISYISVGDLVDLEAMGVAAPAGLGCERRGNGALEKCTSGFGNLGYIKTSGFDLATNYSYELPAGTLSTALNASYVANYEQNNGLETVKYAGTLGSPKWRGDLVTTYATADFDFSWTMNYIGRMDDGGSADADAEAWVTHDFQFNYFTPINSTVTLGVQNAFDKAIPVYASGGRPYDFYLYNAYGTISYLRYTQNF